MEYFQIEDKLIRVIQDQCYIDDVSFQQLAERFIRISSLVLKHSGPKYYMLLTTLIADLSVADKTFNDFSKTRAALDVDRELDENFDYFAKMIDKAISQDITGISGHDICIAQGGVYWLYGKLVTQYKVDQLMTAHLKLAF